VPNSWGAGFQVSPERGTGGVTGSGGRLFGFLIVISIFFLIVRSSRPSEIKIKTKIMIKSPWLTATSTYHPKEGQTAPDCPLT